MAGYRAVWLIAGWLAFWHFAITSNCCRIAAPVVAGRRVDGQDLDSDFVSSAVIFGMSVSPLLGELRVERKAGGGPEVVSILLAGAAFAGTVAIAVATTASKAVWIEVFTSKFSLKLYSKLSSLFNRLTLCYEIKMKLRCEINAVFMQKNMIHTLVMQKTPESPASKGFSMRQRFWQYYFFTDKVLG